MPDKKPASNADLLNRLLSAHEHIGELREEASTAKFSLSEERAKSYRLASDLEYWKSHASSVERQAKAQETELEKLRTKIAHGMCDVAGFDKVAGHRIVVIREVREATNLGLREAKELVDNWLVSKGWTNPYVQKAS